MKNRFFLINLAIIVSVATVFSLIHDHFFKEQRLSLIDNQIEETKAKLLASKLFSEALRGQPTKLEDVITEVLKEERIGKIFILRRQDGSVVYQSFNVDLLSIQIPKVLDWVSLRTEKSFLRIGTLDLPATDGLYMQVGVSLDPNFVDWEIVDGKFIAYNFLAIILLFFIAVLLTHVLMSPLRTLINYLSNAKHSVRGDKLIAPLPQNDVSFLWGVNDEFLQLYNSIQKLVDRINHNHRRTRSWTAQMAHELKTPLAILRGEVEESVVDHEAKESMLKELDWLSQTISHFLDWAELENSHMIRDLHATKMSSISNNIAGRMNKVLSRPIQVECVNDFSVISNPIHLEQLISNLLGNAVKHSPEGSLQKIRIESDFISIQDTGPGIPKEVLQSMGTPFNVGRGNRNKKGTGLGLAWVQSLAGLYGWKVSFHTSQIGTKVDVHFGETISKPGM